MFTEKKRDFYFLKKGNSRCCFTSRWSRFCEVRNKDNLCCVIFSGLSRYATSSECYTRTAVLINQESEPSSSHSLCCPFDSIRANIKSDCCFASTSHSFERKILTKTSDFSFQDYFCADVEKEEFFEKKKTEKTRENHLNIGLTKNKSDRVVKRVRSEDHRMLTRTRTSNIFSFVSVRGNCLHELLRACERGKKLQIKF